MAYVVCEPGGGIFQGVCMGLVFCYSGPGSDLDKDEITYFPSEEAARECKAALVMEARGESIPILMAMEVVHVFVDADLDKLALEWVAKGKV